MPRKNTPYKSKEDAFQELKQAGCEDFTLRLLLHFFEQASARGSLCGDSEDGKQLESDVRAVRHAAGIVRRWNKSLLGIYKIRSTVAQMRVPELLERLADQFEDLAPDYSRRRNYVKNVARARLTNYVIENTITKKPYDRAVATLIGVDVDRQHDWRVDNKQLLAEPASRVDWGTAKMLRPI